MSREEVQINDLEPSIIGEDVTGHAIQIRGVDGNGNEGPWSTILVYESPELLPSLQSNNYVPDQSGWFLDNDGTFEVNDGFIRGTLQSSNYVPGVSGWALDQNGVVEFDQGVFRGALEIGTNTFRVDSNGNLSIGGSSASNAPFRVNTNGQIQAMSINGNFIQSRTIRANRIRVGEITADEIADSTITGAKILGGTITGANIADATISGARIANSTITGGNIANATITDAKIVSLDADKITAGEIRADVVFVGQLNGATGTFSGNLTAESTEARTLVATVAMETGTIFGRANVGLNLFAGGANTLSLIGRNVELAVSPLGAGDVIVKSNAGNRGLVVEAAPSGTSSLANLRWNAITNRFERFSPQSSIRYKQDVVYSEELTQILDLKPCVFKYKNEVESFGENAKLRYGLIAEEVYDAGLEIFVEFEEDDSGLISGLYYDKITVALIPIIKNLKERIHQLEEQLNGN